MEKKIIKVRIKTRRAAFNLEEKLTALRIQLEEIAAAMEKVGNEIRYETEILNKELEERLALGLQGEDAIKHYNAFMARYELFHLIVQE